jgi:predicted dehydrogenase
MTFEGGKVATLQSSVCGVSDRRGAIFGTKGFIEVTNINNPEEIKVFNKEYQEIASYVPPKQITGYEYEVEACVRALENGDLECQEMPHEETIKVMEIMDRLREAWKYEIPVV